MFYLKLFFDINLSYPRLEQESLSLKDHSVASFALNYNKSFEPGYSTFIVDNIDKFHSIHRASFISDTSIRSV